MPSKSLSNKRRDSPSGPANFPDVASVRHNFSHGFQGQATYIWSHALDDISGNGFTAWSYGTVPSITAPQIPSNPHVSCGNNDSDVRHALSTSYIWEPGFDKLVSHRLR